VNGSAANLSGMCQTSTTQHCPTAVTTSISDRAEPHVEGYQWIPLTAVRTAAQARIDYFTQSPDDRSPALLHEGRRGLGPEQIAQIERHALNKVLMRRSDLPVISASISKSLESVVDDNRLTIGERFALVQLGLWEQLEHNSRRLYSEQFVEVAQQAGVQIARLLGKTPILASELYEHLLRDNSRAVHLTNVAGYAVLLAYETGVRGMSELEKIATGALLHEFGKLFLPTEVLDKTGRLTVQERELIERAPQLGYEKLYMRRDLEFGQLMMVYQQSERFDGSGYPVGVESEEIHPWARILAVADVFDTMISRRAYRRENRVGEALLYLSDNASQHFDPKVVRCWMTIFPQQ
jgi:HD-GYP domain-containing protein (c-di-GMP phosphodiesterase class II)